MIKHKKGQVMDQLGALGIGIVVLAVTLAVVFLIMSQVGANATVAADGNATAALDTLTEAATDIPDWVPIVVITVIGALILSLISLFRRST